MMTVKQKEKVTWAVPLEAEERVRASQSSGSDLEGSNLGC